MPSIALLQNRLQQIAYALEQSGQALALLGLGSTGLESSRMDTYSDLDFFAIVRPGSKQKFIQDLFWLEQCAPVVYRFQNTPDGHKVMFNDGVFCDFAVFEPQELANIPFAHGQLIWQHMDFDSTVCEPNSTWGHYHRNPNRNWHLQEALCNLYTGVCRYKRGEKLSAMKLVQQLAIDHILDLIYLDQPFEQTMIDPYMPDRRVEAQFQGIEDLIAGFCLGYNHTLESAENILDWLQQHYTVSVELAEQIRYLIRS